MQWFVDYLTKCPEVLVTPDQSVATIANILVREISVDNVFLRRSVQIGGGHSNSELMKEVEKLLSNCLLSYLHIVRPSSKAQRNPHSISSMGETQGCLQSKH